MRLIRLVLVVLVCSVMQVVVGAGPALACSCAYAQPRIFVDNADEIVAGTLVRIEDPPQRPITSSADPVHYTVAVDRVYQGDVGAEVEFDSAVSGASCGLEGMVVDRRYIVFLDAHGPSRTASLCGGTAPASHRLESAVERLTGAPTRPAAATSVDEPPARTVAPRWSIATGVLGIALLGGIGLWLRRRTS